MKTTFKGSDTESSILSPMSSRLVCAVLASCLLTGGCGSSDSRRADISLHAKPGDIYKIELSLSSHYEIEAGEASGPIQHEELKMDQLNSLECTEVSGETSTWKVKSESITASGTGSMQGQAARLKQTQGEVEMVIRDKQNRRTDKKPSNVFEPVFPNRPVSVGDQWRGEVVIQGAKAILTYRFEGIEMVDGIETAKISGSPQDSPGVKMTKPFRIWIESSTGWPIKGEGEFDVAAPGYRVVATIKLTRK